jgi:hypothetical protein
VSPLAFARLDGDDLHPLGSAYEDTDGDILVTWPSGWSAYRYKDCGASGPLGLPSRPALRPRQLVAAGLSDEECDEIAACAEGRRDAWLPARVAEARACAEGGARRAARALRRGRAPEPAASAQAAVWWRAPFRPLRELPRLQPGSLLLLEREGFPDPSPLYVASGRRARFVWGPIDARPLAGLPLESCWSIDRDLPGGARVREVAPRLRRVPPSAFAGDGGAALLARLRAGLDAGASSSHPAR